MRSTVDHNHATSGSLGILLVNLGTPEAPTASAVRKYLSEFLSDPRVVDKPRWLWWCILHGIILRIRPGRSAKNYQKIWADAGSPLLVISKKLANALQQQLASKLDTPVQVELAMRYGQPSIQQAVDALYAGSITQLLILPLYPQFSVSTTASIFDSIADCFRKKQFIPALRFINHYHDHDAYIESLANTIRESQQKHGQPDKLIFSFHGLPKHFIKKGDPYYDECQTTTRLVTEKLQLADDRWQLTFQSRMGTEQWLSPYTDKTLQDLAQQGCKHVHIICPGFAADCLETLEEIDMQNRGIFLSAGGEHYHYIPALNDSPAHINMLAMLVKQNIDS